MTNLNNAFEVAEKHLDIPKMLDAEGELVVLVVGFFCCCLEDCTPAFVCVYVYINKHFKFLRLLIDSRIENSLSYAVLALKKYLSLVKSKKGIAASKFYCIHTKSVMHEKSIFFSKY